MTAGTGDVAGPSETAAAVAPIIDRLRMAMMNGALASGPPASFVEAGLDLAESMMLGYLRNIWPDRVVSRAAVGGIFTYQPEKPVDQVLDLLVAKDLLDEPADGRIQLTARGQALMRDLHTGASTVADAKWMGSSEHLAAVTPLVSAVLDAARATGGETFSVMAPGRLPDGLSLAGQLAEKLTGLRFHRFDAHIAAWRTAGYSVGELEGLDSAARAAVEAETNRRDGLPYEVLTEGERLALVAHLDALPI